MEVSSSNGCLHGWCPHAMRTWPSHPSLHVGQGRHYMWQERSAMHAAAACAILQVATCRRGRVQHEQAEVARLTKRRVERNTDLNTPACSQRVQTPLHADVSARKTRTGGRTAMAEDAMRRGEPTAPVQHARRHWPPPTTAAAVHQPRNKARKRAVSEVRIGGRTFL
jgi:hypothetical protein